MILRLEVLSIIFYKILDYTYSTISDYTPHYDEYSFGSCKIIIYSNFINQFFIPC